MLIEIECKFRKFNSILFSRTYVRRNNISYVHLNAMRKAFLDCDESGDRRGIITKRDFLFKIAEANFKFPLEFLMQFVSDI